MAEPPPERKMCECVFLRTNEGERVCICDAPCAYDAEGKIRDYMCKCDVGEGRTCECKFQVKCNRNEGPCPTEKDTFTCKTKDLTFQIQKCVCCEIIRTECEACIGLTAEKQEAKGIQTGMKQQQQAGEGVRVEPAPGY